MNCHALRKLFLESRIAGEDSAPSAFDAHCVGCPDCRRWQDEQVRFDALVATWVTDVPSIDLSDSILEAHLRTLASSTLPSIATADPHYGRFIRRRLVAFLGALAASLVFLVPRMENLPSISVVSAPSLSQEAVDAAPVESIVSSLRNVVANTSLPPGSSLALIPSSEVLSDWRVGSIELQPTADAALPTSDWTDVRRELEPLETEVKQALGFIWQALPQEEI